MAFLLPLWMFLPLTAGFVGPISRKSVTTCLDGSKTSNVELSSKQKSFTIGYLNKHHGDLLYSLADAFSPLGQEMAEANVFSGGSYAIEEVQVTAVDETSLTLEAQVARRGQPVKPKPAEISLNAKKSRRRRDEEIPMVPDDPNRTAIDDLVRRLIRLANICGHSEASGQLIQLALQLEGAGIGKLPENMYLNQVPHNTYVRDYFYQQATTAVLDAVIACGQGKIGNRMLVTSEFPEMNPSMDSYRIGTILEMIRTIGIRLAEENLRVRICVQGSMGVGIFTGVPKQLNGVNKLLQMMDWQAEEGEANEGMLGDFIRFGAIGPEHVMNTHTKGNTTIYQDDVFILIAPQSMVGTDSSIFPLLKGMVKEAGDRPVILVNPDLKDKPSSGGQQSVRGRQERIDFADSFETVYHFANIYVSGTSYFPILGAMTKLHMSEPWIAHQRRDYVGDDGEIYVPVLAGETKPTGEAILDAFEG